MLEIGADVPVCFYSKTCMMAGVGEDITPIEDAGLLHCVLVNPGVEISTAQIFKAYDRAFPNAHDPLPHREGDLMEIALAGSNDLEPIARALAPQISEVLATLSTQEGAILSRMSGSGATCFGIFGSAEQTQIAAQIITEHYPHWWVVATTLGEAV
jgi:4-diphosphocytidyl-2-C-methyl-D-erythritol kinase